MLLDSARSNSGVLALHPALRQLADPDATVAAMPWDRGQLMEIEARLRATDPARTAELTIPYWDFTQPPSGQAWPAAFERSGSPLFVGANDTTTPRFNPAFWSYHAYIDVVRQQWEQTHGPLARGMVAHLWIGERTVEIRVRRDLMAA